MQDKLVVSVSVIIPCFRCVNTIHRAVESIVQQTQKPAEVILVDDASDDDTLSILYFLEKKYPNWVKVIALSKNSGAASARNAGWEIATQPFVALLDADDAWHPTKIEIQYQFMQNNPEIVLCGHSAKIISDGTQPHWALNDFGFKIISKTSLLLSNPFVTPSVMMKKDLTFRFNHTKRYMEDHLLWLQIIFNQHQVAKLSPALVAIYKPMYGTSGLSANLWAMEKSDLDNYWLIYKDKNIGFHAAALLSIYSLAKYFRRLIIVSTRSILFDNK